ncbi:MAG: type I DNA topoisomerase [Candidatus Eisenbacteria bacterium]|nr:type I DNA topoisomerase [Candidatus Eisenbacteria bacterium]
MATSKSRTEGKKAPAAKKKKATRKAAVKASNTAPAAKRKRAAKDTAAEATPEDEAEVEAAGSRAAGKRLVIVESPTKSKTLNKFLGKDFMVMASNGHVMDLPKSQLGVDLENNFEPEYVPIRTKNQALGKIRAAARHAAHIYLAPDPDREGEAIAWHLAMALEGAKCPIQRLTFNEITQRAVTEALQGPRDLDMNLVNAQQARRVLDRLVGYKVSPFVWSTVKYGLSAGRVQSVALRLICERESLIRAFVPEEYWTIEVDYETPEQTRFTSRLVRVGDDKLENGQLRGALASGQAAALAAELEKTPARISGIEIKPRKKGAVPPFITSTLQQAASNRYGFTSQRTMQIAQKLYEGIELKGEGSVGLITYMRTDSPRLSNEALAEIRTWLGKEYGDAYVPEKPNFYKSKKGAQEAHEAIRPSSIERSPSSIRSFLTEEQFKLYDLIWKRAVASQATPAEYDMTTVDIEAGRLGLRASGSVLRFPGWLKVYGRDEDDEAEEGRLPELKNGSALTVASAPVVEEEGEEPRTVRPDQHFTQPPPRYTDASLVKALEEENIGRPSTYATIVSTITKRDYVEREGRSLKPTDLGMLVTKLLVDTFPDVFNVEFTAGMEEELDEIEEGKREWHAVVRELWDPLSRDLESAKKKVKTIKEELQQKTDIDCPVCGRKLVKKFGRNGAFLACPGYPECKHTQPLDASELPVPVEGTCKTCGAGLVARNGPFGRYIHCERRPECKYTQPFTLGVKCPKCAEGEIAEKKSRRGKLFYSCTRYPACDFAMWDRPRPTPCDTCGNPYLVEKVSKSGMSLLCPACKSRFPAEPAGA